MASNEIAGLTNDVATVSGTLNVDYFAKKDLDNAKHAWLNIKPSDKSHIGAQKLSAYLTAKNIATPTLYLKDLSTEGFFSRKNLSIIIERYLADKSIKNFRLPCYICATKVEIKKTCVSS